MPSTYAHYRFGQEVLAHLPKSLRKTILQQEELFHIGVHGPDILFYYKPLYVNPVNHIGHEMHKHSGRHYFQWVGELLKQEAYPTSKLAYVYGFLCHFALDRACHGYVNDRVAASGVSHTEIEMEFDRRLLVYDGYHPFQTSLITHIRPSEENAWIIAELYPAVSTPQIKKALDSFVYYNELLRVPDRAKRCVIDKALEISGHTDIKHMMMSLEPNPMCRKSNETLAGLYKAGLKDAVRHVAEYVDVIEGNLPWSSWYNENFESQLIGWV